MPVKRRPEKRRLDPATELAAWSLTFQCGTDYLQQLPRIGVRTNDYSRPDLAIAEDAWRRLGARFLAEPQERHPIPAWALTKFGDPHAH